MSFFLFQTASSVNGEFRAKSGKSTKFMESPTNGRKRLEIPLSERLTVVLLIRNDEGCWLRKQTNGWWLPYKTYRRKEARCINTIMDEMKAFDRPARGRVLKILWNENHEISQYIVEFFRTSDMASSTMDNKEKNRYFEIEEIKQMMFTWELSPMTLAGPEPYEHMFRTLLNLHPFDFCANQLQPTDNEIIQQTRPNCMFTVDEEENLYLGTTNKADQPTYTAVERKSFKEAIEKIIYPSRFINFRAFQVIFKTFFRTHSIPEATVACYWRAFQTRFVRYITIDDFICGLCATHMDQNHGSLSGKVRTKMMYKYYSENTESMCMDEFKRFYCDTRNISSVEENFEDFKQTCNLFQIPLRVAGPNREIFVDVIGKKRFQNHNCRQTFLQI